MKIDYTRNVSDYDEVTFTSALEKYQETIKNDRAIGCIGAQYSQIDLSDVSHTIEEAVLSYPNLHLRIRILSTPEGEKLKCFWENDFIYFAVIGLGKRVDNVKHFEIITQIAAYGKN